MLLLFPYFQVHNDILMVTESLNVSLTSCITKIFIKAAPPPPCPILSPFPYTSSYLFLIIDTLIRIVALAWKSKVSLLPPNLKGEKLLQHLDKYILRYNLLKMI